MRNFFEFGSLLHHINPARDHRYPQIQVLGGENFELFNDLIGKFSSWCDDQSEDAEGLLS